MARETARELAIGTPVQTPIYQDQQQITRKLGMHLAEMWSSRGTGAGGAGFVLSGIPFEPAAVLIYSVDGTPYMQLSPPGRLGVAAEQLLIILAAAGGATAIPAGVRVAGPPVSWTLTIPTGLAGDGVVVEVMIWGYKDLGGSQ